MSTLVIEQQNEFLESKDVNEKEFSIKLNGTKDLENQLIEFKKNCMTRENQKRKKPKHGYYNLGLMAKLELNTSGEEMKRLLKNEFKTFLIDTVSCNKPSDLEQMYKIYNEALLIEQLELPNVKLVTGLALEIIGDNCRLGRIRNNCTIFVEKAATMTLTTNEAYRYCCFKEICYVLNLSYYLSTLQIGAQIAIGKEVSGTVVKKLESDIAILIEEAGIIDSYAYIKLPAQCYSLVHLSIGYSKMFDTTLQLLKNMQVDFLVISNLHNLHYLRTLRNSLKEKENIQIIGTFDLEYLNSQNCDIYGLMRKLDYVWLPNLFNMTAMEGRLVSQDLLPLAKRLGKPIIATVPLERCCDFKCFENHDFLWKIDCIFIEKSFWCNKYPLIVRKLLPINLNEQREGCTDKDLERKQSALPSQKSVEYFIVRTIRSIDCKGIFIHSKCQSSAYAMARPEIYCTVYVMLPFADDDDRESDAANKLVLYAKSMNLRRNLKPVLYTKGMNESNFKPLDFGIENARSNGSIQTGDFIITLEIGDETSKVDETDDAIILRAFYLPPLSIGKQSECERIAAY